MTVTGVAMPTDTETSECLVCHLTMVYNELGTWIHRMTGNVQCRYGKYESAI
jgi:hypothetical protein